MFAASVGALNYWLVVGFLWGAGIATVMNKVGHRLSVGVALLVGAASGAVTVAAYLRHRIRRLGPDVVGRFDVAPIEGVGLDRLRNIVDGLAVATGAVPVQTVVIEDGAPNALTLGFRPEHTTIIVTTGLLQQLSRDELEAVLAVQFCEIRRLDVMVRTVVRACTDGAIGVYEGVRPESLDPRKWLLPLLVAPSMVVAKAIRSRSRRLADHGADDMAVAITRHPAALIGALEKLRADPQVVVSNNRDLGELWFETLPVPRDRQSTARANRALEERLQRLRSRTAPT